MVVSMTEVPDRSETTRLVEQALRGDQRALGELLGRHRERLRRMNALRLDRRLQGRFDPSDVVQEACLDAARRLPEYHKNPKMPFFLWLRFLTGQRLLDEHRKHLGAAARTSSRWAGTEISMSAVADQEQKRSQIMRKHVFLRSSLLLMALCLVCTLRPTSAGGGGDDERRIERGFDLAPVPLDLNGKDFALVGLGSYFVNGPGGCNDCHTHPSYAQGGNPFLGQPTKINTAEYLAGGRQFGPGVTSRNLTPDATGLPAGLTSHQFLNVLHTGNDPQDPGTLLQVMPWPDYSNMTDRDIRAMYEYLRAIPSLPDNPNPGP
jgi:DNA-directed RNA polymerase specialized sigma24 family protein